MRTIMRIWRFKNNKHDMSVNVSFINDTKKQVVSVKMLFGNFEISNVLLAYLNICAGDSFRTVVDENKWTEEWMYDGMHSEYKQIDLYKFILGDDLHNCCEFERLRNTVNAP